MKPRVRYVGMSGDSHMFRIAVETSGGNVWREEVWTTPKLHWDSVLRRIKEIQRWK